MKTEELVAKLAGEAEPSGRLAPAGLRWLGWSTASAVFAVAAVALWGVRPDFAARLHDRFFLKENALLLAAALFCGRAAFALGVPGEERPWSLLAGLGAAAAWGAVLMAAGGSDRGEGLRCLARIAALGAAPLLGGIWLLRRGAPLQARWSAACLAAAALGLGACGCRALCAIDRPTHILVWHALPVLAACLLLAAAGARLFGGRPSRRE